MTHTETLQATTKLLDVMPILGFGTWEITGKQCVNSVQHALELGYRHIDTAQMYGNEKEVGKGMNQSGVDRDDIFLTTKIATNNLTPDRIIKTANDSLTRLQTDYVNLLLIHWPTPDMNLDECLEAMNKLKAENKVLHLGVSNFNPSLFEEALQTSPLLTNQIKFTPSNPDYANLEMAKKHHKIITAYSPLERGSLTHNSKLEKIGQKYGKSAAQVSLRWLIQLENVAVIPKASNEQHQKENMEIFDFELSKEDFDEITTA